MVWTEQGLEAAEMQWDRAYREKLDECKDLHEPGTAGARACFGDWFEADRHVETSVRAAVALLRTYWTARAAGKSDPGWAETQRRVAQIVGDLPPLPREYFERIKGIR
jgi:hypothetical protein